jgi:hypothetical protein
MSNDADDNVEELGLSVSLQDEEIILDEQVMTEFFHYIEEASNKVLVANDLHDYRMELAVTLLSSASQVAIDLELNEEDLVFLLIQSFERVTELNIKQREEEIKYNFDIN